MTWMVLLAAFLLVPLPARGADGIKHEIPTLAVSSTGTISVSPDTAFVTFGTETAGKSLADAQRQNSAIMLKVLSRLLDLKIDKERIQTSSFTVNPQYRQPPKRPSDAPPAPPEIMGYTVGNTMVVEVRDLQLVATVIEESLAAGANHFQGIQWGLRDEQPSRIAALKLAATKAREKAASLGEALNVKLVKVFHATEGVHVVRPAAYMGRAMMAMDGGGSEVPVSPGEMKVEATVTLEYEIAQ